MRDQRSKLRAYLRCPHCGFDEYFNILDKEDYYSICEIIVDINKLITVRCMKCLLRFECADNLVITKRRTDNE